MQMQNVRAVSTCALLREQAMQAFMTIGHDRPASLTQERVFRTLLHNPAPLHVPDKSASPLRKPASTPPSRLGSRALFREVPDGDGTHRPITAPIMHAGRGQGISGLGDGGVFARLDRALLSEEYLPGAAALPSLRPGKHS